MNSETDYIYDGVPIKPQIIAYLTKELFGGKLVERQVIIEQVLATRLKRGGLPSKASSFPLAVTKALTSMQKTGEAERGVIRLLENSPH